MKKNIFIKIFVAVLVLVLLGLVVFFYLKYKNSSQGEIINLTGKISKFMILPDEIPTIATVTDKEKLMAQPFFKNADNGDKVLIFMTAAKAILYRPKIDKVIEVASVQSLTEETNLTPSPVKEKIIPKVVIYNGTTTSGLASVVEKKVVSTFPEVSIVKKGNAIRRDYSETLVVDLTGNNNDLVIKMASNFGARVVTIPEGEDKPDGDILLILGQKHP